MISRVRQYYDNLSRGYNALYGNDQLNKWHFIKKLVPKKKGIVLDVGCGTSLITRLIKAEFIVGLDISRKMVDAGRERGISYVVANAEKLPFKDNSFDIIYSITLLQDLDNKDVALSEWRKAGKTAVVSVMKGMMKRSDVTKALKKAGFSIKKYVDEEKDNIFLVT
jgi:malonyl-CoA O-methyltransferase